MQSIGQILVVQPGQGSQVAGAISSLTAALKQAQSGTILQLVPGTYSQATGEQFPLLVPSGVILRSHQPQTPALIEGGGPWQSPAGQVAVSLVISGDARLQDLTLSYPAGTGLWIQSGRPHLKNCHVLNCGQDGLRVMGEAMPTIADSRFEGNSGTGIRFGELAKGEIRRCQLIQNQTGLRVSDQAAPLIVATDIHRNQVGIDIRDAATPVLRQVSARENRTVGLLVRDHARPDLGQPQSEGLNILRQNGDLDVHHQGRQVLVAVGNDLLPQRLSGKIILAASQVPTIAAIAPLHQGESPPPAAVPPPSSGPVSVRFQDLQGHWAAPFGDALARQGLIKGFPDGSFRPDLPVTRAQFAALISASFSRPIDQAAINFVDVGAGYWAAAAIARAQRQGFLGGYPDGSFRPETPITRVQAIVALANGLQLAAAPASAIQMYGDRAQIPSYAVESVAAATQKQLVVNYPNLRQLRPLEPLTRAEAAALVYQGLVVEGKAAAIASEAIVRPKTVQVAFADINGHWAAPFIAAIAQQNWVSGFADGRFRPDQPMTRAEYAVLLVNAFHPQPIRSPREFFDVPPGHWAAAAIAQAYQSGFLSGFPDGAFAPHHPMVRVQAWTSLVSGLELEPSAVTAADPLAAFSDAGQIPDYARQMTVQAIRLGLVTNPPHQPQLHPNQIASRADIVTAVYQALVAQQRLPAIGSPYLLSG